MKLIKTAPMRVPPGDHAAYTLVDDHGETIHEDDPFFDRLFATERYRDFVAKLAGKYTILPATGGRYSLHIEFNGARTNPDDAPESYELGDLPT